MDSNWKNSVVRIAATHLKFLSEQDFDTRRGNRPSFADSAFVVPSTSPEHSS
jgi:hypothetical protein